MIAILLLRIAGVLLLLLAILNLFVPKRFAWAEELPRLSLLNRQIFVVHAGFIILIVVLMAALTLLMPHDLMMPSRLSRALLAGLAIFWFARLLVQWLYYDPRIWRGKRFNTVMHFVFTAFWCYLVGTFAFALWQNMSAGGPR
jgi:hypothetical protein